MMIDVYVGNGYVTTIEVETQEDADNVALEAAKNWVENTCYWMPAENELYC